MQTSFRCYLVHRDAGGRATAQVVERPIDDLPPGEVLIRVAYSSLNYKDALSATGHPGVTKKYPHVPGIDAAGVVAESCDPAIAPRTEVLVTGFDLGQNTWGGFAEFVRVPAAWVLPLPQGLSLRESMILGTAGLTAGMSVQTLIDRGVQPADGHIVVTGASGGVGSLAVAILSRAGFQVAASTGKSSARELLTQLGAIQVIGREEVNEPGDRPLLAVRWAGAIDTVGGNTLATLVRSLRSGGCVAACGLVGGAELKLTVYPFLLRGVDLAGIDSAQCPLARRSQIWQRLAGEWKPALLEAIAAETDLAGLEPRIADILAGRVTGRIVVKTAAG